MTHDSQREWEGVSVCCVLETAAGSLGRDDTWQPASLPVAAGTRPSVRSESLEPLASLGSAPACIVYQGRVA